MPAMPVCQSPGLPIYSFQFWQGPDPQIPEDWPYEGDWVADIKREGPENYNEASVE